MRSPLAATAIAFWWTGSGPAGSAKARLPLHTWLRDLSPSDQLRRWFHARPENWLTFRKRYLKELALPQAAEALDELYRLAQRKKNLTLLYASRNELHNNAVVLKELLDGMRKPPTGTGPGAVRALRHRQAKRLPR